jgi:superfamily II DNA or RNA helicase
MRAGHVPLPLFDGDHLRPYQKEAIIAIRQAFREGHKAVLLVLPTGVGKTVTFVALPREGARVMVVSGQDAVNKQTVATIRRLRGRVASVEQAMLKADAGDEWIVATHQTLKMNGRYKRFVGHVDLIIIDECDIHFSVKFREMMREFIEAGARVLGVTATPHRVDKQTPLFGFYTTCPYSMELADAFKQGWLVKPRVVVHTVKSINFDALTKTKVDFLPHEIDGILMSEAVRHDICNLVVQNHRKSHGVIRCRSVPQAKAIREMLTDRYGLKVSCVWGEQNPEERELEIKKFESGENTLITNCRVLGRGWDCPMVNEIFNAAPTKSKATFLQGLGRGTRALTGVLDGKHTAEERLAAIAASAKPDWIFHDITNTSRFHSPVTAIDMLLAGPKQIIEKIKEENADEEVTLDELDASLQAELDALKELERLEREAEKERRKKLVVGVTFDSRSRDLFARPDAKSPKVRGYHVPFGRWRGRPLRDPAIPLSWLQWALRDAKLNAMWTAAFKQEVERREKVLAGEEAVAW